MPAWARSIIATVCLSCLGPLLPPVASPAAAALFDSFYAPGADGGTLLDARMVAFATMLGALSLAVFLLALAYVFARRRLARRIAAQRREIAGLRADLDRAEALLEGTDQVCIAFSPDMTVAHGTLAGIQDMPADADGILRFSSWLASDSTAQLAPLISGLIERGDGFHTIVNTRAGLHIEAQGRASGGMPVLTLRNLSGGRLREAHLNERMMGLEQELHGLRALLTAAGTPAWSRDAEGRIDWANAAYAEAVGADTPEAAVALKRELFAERERVAIQRGLSTDSTFSGALATVIAGRRTSFEVVAARMGASSIALARDVSHIEEVRGELSRHVEAHRRTLDQIATAVAIFGADQKLKFCNTAYRELWQLDPAWLDAGPADGEVLDRLRSLGRLPEQADYRTWRGRQLEAYTSLQPQEQWWHLPDGRTLRTLAQPHPEGGVTYLYDNVTERLELESRHEALEKVQRETLDNLNEGVSLFSSTGRLRFYNASFARLWRLSTAELDREPHIDQVISWSRVLMDDPEAWSDLKLRVIAIGENRQPGVVRFDRPDGSVIDCLAVPLPGGDTLITHHDVTDAALAERALRERAEALEETDRVKTAFIRHVSYVLRAPLTTITGYADLLASDKSGDMSDRQREFTSHILTSSHALLAIINDILDLATLDAGIMELDLGEVNVGQIIRTAADGLGDRVHQADVRLNLADPGADGIITADGKRLTQIVFNLIANAIAHSPAGGAIAVDCTRDEHALRLTVTDQGPGIPADMQKTIFDRFESMPAKGGQRGAGLGLSIVKSLTELHGGQVHLRSAPGEGTAVTCVFPVAPAAGRTAETPRAGATGTTGG